MVQLQGSEGNELHREPHLLATNDKEHEHEHEHHENKADKMQSRVVENRCGLAHVRRRRCIYSAAQLLRLLLHMMQQQSYLRPPKKIIYIYMAAALVVALVPIVCRLKIYARGSACQVV